MNELLLKYLNSVKLFEAPNDQGSSEPKLVIESVDNRKDRDEEDKNVVLQDDGDKTEDDEEEEEEEEDSEEEKARKEKEKEDRKQERLQRKFDKLAAEKTKAEKEVEALRKQLAEKPIEGLTEEEVERRAAAKAEQLAAAKEAEKAQKEFEKTADSLIKAANKVDKEFEKKIKDVAADTGVLMPKYMVEILSDLDNKNGGEILARLADDEDLYEEICTLSERRMTKRLDKMSEELKNRNKIVKPKERVLPDPIEPINDGSNNRGNVLPKNPTQNMDEYVRIRNAQAEAYRKNKMMR
jgi:hypothetical protein